MSRTPSALPLARPGLGLGLAVLLVVQAVGPAQGYTARCVGVDSNFLFLDGKVVFIQGTGSLTVLDLETGEVLLRKKPEGDSSYHGTLKHCPYGALMIDYNRVVLLDQKTLDPVWGADACYDAAADAGFVVSHDGKGTVRCRHAQTGQLLWNAEMDRVRKIVAVDNKALVATSDYHGGCSALKLFDLESGRELLHKQADADVRWLKVYFDGQFIYVVTASENTSQLDQPQSVTTFDLEGDSVAAVDYKSPQVIPRYERVWSREFILEGKVFMPDGQVRPVYPHEPEILVKEWKRNHRLVRSLPGGVLVGLTLKDGSGHYGEILRMIRTEGRWELYLSHLGSDSYPGPIGEQDGKLLVGNVLPGLTHVPSLHPGSHLGHVECIDIQTGRPLWTYVFPSIWRTQSFSFPHGMPPYLTQQAAAYRSGVSKLGETCGSVLLPADFDPTRARWSELRAASRYPGRMVVDPSPDDPFPELPEYLRCLAFHALLPLVGIPLFWFLTRSRRPASDAAVLSPATRKKWGHVALAVPSLLFSVSPALGLLWFGRVDYSWTVTLKVVFALTILCVAYAVLRLFLQRRWILASALTAITAYWVNFMKYAWWFA